jgi:glycosyltransferase involved in cell wall biosynthesis
MDLMPQTHIVIPCYNEAPRLQGASFLDEVKQDPDLHFIFVNDGSTDHTAEMLNELCCHQPHQLSVIHLPRNEGKAEAVRRGLLEAAYRDAAFIGYWDADLAAPLAEIKNLRCPFARSEIEIVFGSRVRLLGRSITRNPLRHLLGRIFGTTASFALDLPVYDTQCGAKLFKNTALLKQVLSTPFASRWAFDVEILARFLQLYGPEGRQNFLRSIVEVPLSSWHDVPGSKIKPLDSLLALVELAHIALILRH